MYAGRIVETGTVEEVLLSPKMPYTQGLLNSIPSETETRQGAQRDPGRGAQPVPDAARLQVPAPMSVRMGSLPDGADR